MSLLRSKQQAISSGTSLSWTIGFVAAALAVFSLKIYLAYSTQGAPDISAWKDFLSHIQQCGVCVYQTGGWMQEPQGARVTPFNHPPFVIHFLRMIGSLSSILGLDFAFVLRALTSVFDLGSAVLVYQLLRRSGLFNPAAFVLYLFAPATIIISGFHGQTDTVMIFFVLLAAFLIDRPMLAGLAFACALSIKIVPVIYVVAFIFYLRPKDRLWFVCSTAATGLLLALPFIAQDPLTIIREVLGYSSFPGRWGWTLALYELIGPSRTFWIASRIGGYVRIAYLWYLSIKMNRKNVLLFVQLGLISFMLLAFTPSWGANYMSWLDPFAATLGVVPALAYYSTSGAQLSHGYFGTYGSSRLVGIAWLAILFITWLFLRHIKQPGTVIQSATLVHKNRDH